MLTAKTLVVAVDFSDTALDTAAWGRELARSFGAAVHLLHVVPDPLQQPWAVEAPGLDFPGLSDHWRTEARERLHRWLDEKHNGKSRTYNSNRARAHADVDDVIRRVYASGAYDGFGAAETCKAQGRQSKRSAALSNSSRKKHWQRGK